MHTLMHRTFLFLLATALLACSGRGGTAAAGLDGVGSLARAGELLFVGSTDNDELRVLDMVAVNRNGNAIPAYVRAPNPLSPLSIPVIDKPYELASDGRYVFVRSVSGTTLSVVDADRAVLQEIARLELGAPVSAMTTKTLASESAPSVLYLALRDGGDTDLVSLELPADPATLADLPEPATEAIASLPGRSVLALLSLTEEDALVVAARSDEGIDDECAATCVLPLDGGAWRALEGFSAPVRRLATHGGTTALDPEQRIFGILDEASCDTGACVGIESVERADGSLSVDVHGLPMQRLVMGGGYPRDLEIASSLGLLVPSLSGRTVEEIPLVGFVTSSSGDIFAFDPTSLTHIDGDPDAAGPLAPPVLYREDGVLLPYVPGPVIDSFAFKEGAALTETIRITFEGPIPGLLGVALGAGGTFPASSVTVLDRVQVGDRLELLVDGEPCDELAVTGLDAEELLIETSGAVDPVCSGASTFTVRAAGARPYTVLGSASGYMGRTGSGDSFTYHRDYSQRPRDPAAYRPADPAFTFSFGPIVPSAERGDYYQVDATGGARPYAFRLQSRLALRVPAAIVAVSDLDIERIYVAYPSDDLVMSVLPTEMVSGTLNFGQAHP